MFKCSNVCVFLRCRFVVSFHVLDNTVSIFEPKVPNTGIRGGTYLERTKVRKARTLNGEERACSTWKRERKQGSEQGAAERFRRPT